MCEVEGGGGVSMMMRKRVVDVVGREGRRRWGELSGLDGVDGVGEWEGELVGEGGGRVVGFFFFFFCDLTFFVIGVGEGVGERWWWMVVLWLLLLEWWRGRVGGEGLEDGGEVGVRLRGLIHPERIDSSEVYYGFGLLQADGLLRTGFCPSG